MGKIFKEIGAVEHSAVLAIEYMADSFLHVDMFQHQISILWRSSCKDNQFE